MNSISRRMYCQKCDKSFDVLAYRGAWIIEQAGDVNAVPYHVAATQPTCLDPLCGHPLTDSMRDTVRTDAGDVIDVTIGGKPRLN